MNRREFLGKMVAVSAATAGRVAAAERNPWQIGCFNRAWTKWGFDEALDSIAAAGYRIVGLLSTHRGEAFTSAAASREYLAALRRRLKERGLTANMASIRWNENAPLEDLLKDLRTQIDNAARLDLRYLLTFGADNAANYEKFYRAMNGAAAYGVARNVQIALKPHGGASGASAEILKAIDKVGHENFQIWYDAGNIIYYTGKDPVAELEPIIHRVTGFCAKDCPGPKGEVMSQFGTGQVDFTAVFRKLKIAGFSGPIMVEGVRVGATAEETGANALANREYLQRILAGIG